MSKQVVPNSLNFSSNPMSLAIASKSEWRKFGVIGPAVYAPDGTNTFRIRLSSNQILDPMNSWFQIRVNNKATADGGYDSALKYSIFDIFKSYRLISNGSVVEEVRELPLLANFLLKNTVSREWVKETGVMSYGMKPPYELIFANEATANTATGKRRYVETVQAWCPDNRRTSALEGGNNVITQGSSRTYNFQLPFGILAQSQKYIPLGLLGSETFIEFELNDAGRAFFHHNDDTTKYTVDNIYYHAHLISTENSLYSKLKAKMSGNADKSLQIAGQQFSTFVNSTNATDTGSTQVISTQAQSAKSIFTFMVPTASRNASNKFENHGLLAGVTSYHYDVGGKMLPPHKVTVSDDNMGELHNHLKIALGQYGDLDGCLIERQHLINDNANTIPKAVTEDVTTGVSIQRGDACFAMTLESFTKHGGSDIESGTDFASKNIPLKFVYESGGTGAAQHIISYVLQDCITYITDSGSIMVSL